MAQKQNFGINFRLAAKVVFAHLGKIGQPYNLAAD